MFILVVVRVMVLIQTYPFWIFAIEGLKVCFSDWGNFKAEENPVVLHQADKFFLHLQ